MLMAVSSPTESVGSNPNYIDIRRLTVLPASATSPIFHMSAVSGDSVGVSPPRPSLAAVGQARRQQRHTARTHPGWAGLVPQDGRLQTTPYFPTVKPWMAGS